MLGDQSTVLGNSRRFVRPKAAEDCRTRAPAKAFTQRGESPRQAEVSPVCDRRLPRRGDTGWGAAGGELPVRNNVCECMNKVNSIRPCDGTSLRVLSEVCSAAHASVPEVPRDSGEGDRDGERVRKETVNERKAAPPSLGGWRQNGRKRKRDKQGDLPGTTRCSWPSGPKNRPAGVRASIVALKRVTSAERRDAGRWKDGKQNDGRQTDASAQAGYAVVGDQPSAIDLAVTESLADILVRDRQCPHLAETPLTGKPDAGNPPVRFGGRGRVQSPAPTPIKTLARLPEVHLTLSSPYSFPPGIGASLGNVASLD